MGGEGSWNAPFMSGTWSDRLLPEAAFIAKSIWGETIHHSTGDVCGFQCAPASDAFGGYLEDFFVFFVGERTQKSNSEPPENEHMPLKKDGWKMHFPCKNGSFSGEKSFIFGRGGSGLISWTWAWRTWAISLRRDLTVFCDSIGWTFQGSFQLPETCKDLLSVLKGLPSSSTLFFPFGVISSEYYWSKLCYSKWLVIFEVVLL